MSSGRAVTFTSSIPEMPWTIRAGESVEVEGGGTTTILTYKGIAEITGWTVTMTGSTFEMCTTGINAIKFKFPNFNKDLAKSWTDSAKEMTTILQRLTLYSDKIEALANRRREIDLVADTLMDEIEELSLGENRRYYRRPRQNTVDTTTALQLTSKK